MTFATLYLCGSVVTLAVMCVVAAVLRRSSASSVFVMVLVVLISALVWPLLLVAAVQVGALLGLAKAMRAIAARRGRTATPAGAQESKGGRLPAVA